MPIGRTTRTVVDITARSVGAELTSTAAEMDVMEGPTSAIARLDCLVRSDAAITLPVVDARLRRGACVVVLSVANFNHVDLLSVRFNQKSVFAPADCQLAVSSLTASLTIERSASSAAALADIQGDFVSKLSRLEVAFGIVELLAPVSRTARAIHDVVANSGADLCNPGRSSTL
jgi:hypothetical protein